MSDNHLDLSKAKFSTTDNLSDVDLAGGVHTLSDGNVVSVGAVGGELAGYTVKDSSGKLLNHMKSAPPTRLGESSAGFAITRKVASTPALG